MSYKIISIKNANTVQNEGEIIPCILMKQILSIIVCWYLTSVIFVQFNKASGTGTFYFGELVEVFLVFFSRHNVIIRNIKIVSIYWRGILYLF